MHSGCHGKSNFKSVSYETIAYNIPSNVELCQCQTDPTLDGGISVRSALLLEGKEGATDLAQVNGGDGGHPRQWGWISVCGRRPAFRVQNPASSKSRDTCADQRPPGSNSSLGFTFAAALALRSARRGSDRRRRDIRLQGCPLRPADPLELGRTATDHVDVASEDRTCQSGSPFGGEVRDVVGRILESAPSFDTPAMRFEVLRQRAEGACRSAPADRIGRQRTGDHRIGSDHGPWSDLDTGQDDGPRPDVARRVHDDGSDANGAERYFGASIVREDHALGTEEGAVANANERAILLVDVQMINKVDVPADVHPAIPQTLESVTAPDGIKAPFQPCQQRDRV